MKREELKALELSDDAIDKIMALHGKDIETHKQAVITAESERDALKTQLADATKQIEGFKGMKSPEEVDAAVNEWKDKATQAQKDADAQVAKVKFDHALEKALGEYKVKDPADIIHHLKTDMLKLGEDGKFIGLKEQIEPLKASKEYLFTDETVPPRIVTGGGNHSVVSNISAFEASVNKGGGFKSE